MCWITAPDVKGNSVDEAVDLEDRLAGGELADPRLGALEGGDALGLRKRQHGAPLVALPADRVEHAKR